MAYPLAEFHLLAAGVVHGELVELGARLALVVVGQLLLGFLQVGMVVIGCLGVEGFHQSVVAQHVLELHDIAYRNVVVLVFADDALHQINAHLAQGVELGYEHYHLGLGGRLFALGVLFDQLAVLLDDVLTLSIDDVHFGFVDVLLGMCCTYGDGQEQNGEESFHRILCFIL